MPAKELKSARAIAVKALNQINPKRDYTGIVLDSLLKLTEQKQRTTDLVFGTLRNRFAIDMLIEKLAKCPVERIADKLLNIIRTGVYELVYNPQTKRYAIVNEAGENARKVTGKKGIGFVNAVLRQIERSIENRQAPLSQSGTKRVLPQTLTHGCEFKYDILPNPVSSMVDFLSIAFSLPKWLVAEWLNEFGIDAARQICFASNRVPSVYIRPNTLKTTVNGLANKFSQAGIDFEIVEESMLKLKAAKSISNLSGFGEGLFSVQDITASKAVKLLSPQPDWKILDLCAAPGGKTTQLAEITGGRAKIIATDIDGHRLEKVRENSDRLQLKNINIVPYKKLSKVVKNTDMFDCILLDVPCSNTGVLSKRVEVRYRLSPDTVCRLAETQRRLLICAVAMLKPQGVICYSTCSISKEENVQQIKEFLYKNPSFGLKSEQLTLPSAHLSGHDGGYAAILVRK